jgi:hypothetical protein
MKKMNYILIALGALIGLWSVWGYFGSNVEQAAYTVVKKMDGYELRDYPPHIVARTTVKGSYEEAMRAGFRILASYIFGDNTKKENIAMTAPVVAKKGESGQTSESIAMTAPVIAVNRGDAHVISFGMPSSYTMESLPIPNDKRIEIIELPAVKYAVMRFSWYRSDARIKSAQAQLLAALAKDGIEAQGNPSYAGYNAPWTPPWMMRNEVLVELK